MSRECGECQVCCELPMVAPLKKPMFTRCQNQCAQGCAIYAERPEPCRAFQCVWLRGDALLGDDDRPDRMGLMVETCVSEPEGAETLQYVQLWETHPGSLDDAQGRAATFLEALKARWPIRLQRYKLPTEYLAPPHLAHVARELERRAKAAGPVSAAATDPCPCGSGATYGSCHGRR